MAGYGLGVDLGTTWTAAAVHRHGRAELLALAQGRYAVPTIVHVGADGAVAVGEAAERRTLDDAGRVAREVKRRVGDSTPLILGGMPWPPELLLAKVLAWVLDKASAEQGGPPEITVVTHPANWTDFKLDLLRQACRQARTGDVVFVAEPVAAAAWYASANRLDDGQTIAVYDLGGGTFDAAVVRRTASGFEILGRPDGFERLGGVDFDEAVLSTITRQLDGAWDDLDQSDPVALADAAELRRQCIAAKEFLSSDTATAVPVRLPGLHTSVRLTREELETLVRPAIAETIEALRRTVQSAGMDPRQLAAVLLVGGSSRMPIVGQSVTASLGVPTAVDVDPKGVVALGAALFARPGKAAEPAAPLLRSDSEPGDVAPPPGVDGGGSPEGRVRRRRGLLATGLLLAVLACVVVIVLAVRDDRGPGSDGGEAADNGAEVGTDGGSTTITTTEGPIPGDNDPAEVAQQFVDRLFAGTAQFELGEFLRVDERDVVAGRVSILVDDGTEFPATPGQIRLILGDDNLWQVASVICDTIFIGEPGVGAVVPADFLTVRGTAAERPSGDELLFVAPVDLDGSQFGDTGGGADTGPAGGAWETLVDLTGARRGATDIVIVAKSPAADFNGQFAAVRVSIAP